MSITRPVAIILGVVVVASAAALLLASRRDNNAEKQPPTPYQTFQNLGPGSGTATPLSKAFGSSSSHRVFDSEVRFYDLNGLASSDAVLTTEACAAHGSAQLLRTATPVVTTRHRKIRSQNKTALVFSL